MGSNGNQALEGKATPEMVNLTIDGKAVRVPKGTNLIEAAKSVAIDIPYYCYHPHLSIAGNCRMCQVRVKGAPKLEIACNMAVREGMEVSTQHSSKEVQDAQAATLEFILINHPLDCTVCDQAGHCKLQDYHYEYNARPSRFVEDKVHKVKAEPLGPTVMLDGERCIMCTRCIRFCDEVTGTSELGMLNRGDRAVIAVNPGKELGNPLSGTVVDLCPVGALTHRNWRFNTRIWFSNETETICPGCSTGCNVKVAERDGQVVQVKARLNPEVNREWLCDEGRYGFMRFLPTQRLTTPFVGGKVTDWDQALREAAKVATSGTLVFVACDLLLEEYTLLKDFLAKFCKDSTVVLSYRERALTSVEALLISPDYAANFRGAVYAGLVSGDGLEVAYNGALQKLESRQVKQVLLVGQNAIVPHDVTDSVLKGLEGAQTAYFGCSSDSRLMGSCKVVLPGRSLLEKSGLLVNRRGRVQYSERCVPFPEGSEPEWRILARLSKELGSPLVTATNDRELTLHYLAKDLRLKGLTIRAIKEGGVNLDTYRAESRDGALSTPLGAGA